MIAKQLITNSFVPLKSTDTGAFALTRMEESHLVNLPVVDDGVFAGIVSEQDILALDSPEVEISLVSDLHKMVCVNGGQHVYEVLKLFSIYSITVLPVVDDNNMYLGGITPQSVVASLAELIGSQEPGGIIELEIRDQDYSLEEIVQVVESNHAKIRSCTVSSVPGSSNLQVTLKLNLLEIGPLCQAFFRLDYNVTASWSSENMYNDGLRDRFEALMNYLNI
jgi:CBS domain-containing protein